MGSPSQQPAVDRSHHWLQLASGARFNLDGPVERIGPDDVASALAKICRFGGATTEFYSVAQHSVLVADLAVRKATLHVPPDEVRLIHMAALLHDAHEMVLADIVRPTKWWLGDRFKDQWGTSVASVLSTAEALVDRRLAEALGVADVMTDAWKVHRIVKEADDAALAIERRDLMVATDEVWHGIPTGQQIAHHPVIEPLEWRAARRFWLERWHWVREAIEDAT